MKKEFGNGEETSRAHGQMLIHYSAQLIIEETENLLEKWKHPDPYRAPTAPGGSKWERNLPVPSTERKSLTALPHHRRQPMTRGNESLTCLTQRRHTCICKLEQRLMENVAFLLWKYRDVQIAS
jgi:hypothetical protein